MPLEPMALDEAMLATIAAAKSEASAPAQLLLCGLPWPFIKLVPLLVMGQLVSVYRSRGQGRHQRSELEHQVAFC